MSKLELARRALLRNPTCSRTAIARELDVHPGTVCHARRVLIAQGKNIPALHKPPSNFKIIDLRRLISWKLADKLKRIAREDRVSMADVVHRALAEYFARRERPRTRGRRPRVPLCVLLRKLRGVRSQTEVAKLIGVDKAMVCRWESGQALPTREKLGRLARAFAVPVASLELAWRK